MKPAIIVTSIIDYLKSKGWLEYLPEIADGLNQASYSQIDQNLVTVTSAIALKTDQKKELEKTLQPLIVGKIRLKFVIDSQLIGGLKIAYAGKIIDSSLNSQIELMGQKLNYD